MSSRQISFKQSTIDRVVQLGKHFEGRVYFIKKEINNRRLNYYYIRKILAEHNLLPGLVRHPVYRGCFSAFDYFAKHYQRYKNLERKELFNKDEGLYRALLRAGDLGIAIPENFGPGRKPISEEMKKKIWKCRYHYGMSVKDTAKKLKISQASVSRHTWD